MPDYTTDLDALYHELLRQSNAAKLEAAAAEERRRAAVDRLVAIVPPVLTRLSAPNWLSVARRRLAHTRLEDGAYALLVHAPDGGPRAQHLQDYEGVVRSGGDALVFAVDTGGGIVANANRRKSSDIVEAETVGGWVPEEFTTEACGETAVRFLRSVLMPSAAG
jgi:hypothetical protein